MAVKANATISIYRIKEVTSTTNYYLLQSSTAAAPSKPTTDSPGGKWTTSEPAYTDGSTLTLYTVIKTKYSDNTFEYTPVSKSTSYEAAKSAYNKAVNAQNSATSANNKIDNLEIGGRNLLRLTSTLGIYDKEAATSGSFDDGIKFNGNKALYMKNAWQGYYFHLPKIINRCNLKIGDNLTISEWFMFDSVPTKNVSFTLYRASADSSGTIVIPMSDIEAGKWFRISFSFSLTEYSLTSTRTRIESNYYEDKASYGHNQKLYFSSPKLEKGNKATDWTPAPEDSDNVISQDKAPEDTSAVWFNTHDNLFYKYNGEDWIAVSDYNEDISKLKDDVGKIDSTIDGKINAYNNEIKNTYYTKAQVDSQIESNERGIKEYYSGTLQTIREDTTGLSNRITAIEGYIQKGLDDNGQPFVELGTQASPYKLKITNDAIQITYLGEPVSNWKQDLIELNTVITSYLNLGKFSFVINSDDSLSFRKIR